VLVDLEDVFSKLYSTVGQPIPSPDELQEGQFVVRVESLQLCPQPFDVRVVGCQPATIYSFGAQQSDVYIRTASHDQL